MYIILCIYPKCTHLLNTILIATTLLKMFQIISFRHNFGCKHGNYYQFIHWCQYYKTVGKCVDFLECVCCEGVVAIVTKIHGKKVQKKTHALE